MASACVNNTPTKFSWLTPNRPSYTKDDDTKSNTSSFKPKPLTCSPIEIEEREKVSEKSDLENDVADFEFCLHYPVDNDTLPTADELISDGKLMPMMLCKPPVTPEADASKLPDLVQMKMKMKTGRVAEVLSSEGGGDPFLYSPKAPRCASRWREILGFKKMQQNGENSPRDKSNKSIRNLLNRRNKVDSRAGSGNVNLPLLRDLECESVSISSRLSLSSSSSGHEIEDFPRLSLDNEKLSINLISLLKNNTNPPPRLRLVKSRHGENGGTRPVRRTMSTDQSQCNALLGIGVDSPRMNSSGKIVFQSLERSSSSPGSFNGGARLKHGGGGMERSYSANVRASTVLNVPVCSLSKSGSVFGFGQLFSSQQKRDLNGKSYQCISNNSSGSSSGRNRTDQA